MSKLKPLAFFPPCLLLVAVVVFNFTDGKGFQTVMEGAYQWVLGVFGWFVPLLAFVMLAVCGLVYVSPLGRVVIGGRGAKPPLSRWGLFTVVICTNIAIGILFWGPVEPLHHLCEPRPSMGAAPNSPEAASFALCAILLHWTVLPYSFATLIGLMFALAYYNRGRPFTLGAPLSPLLGRHGSGAVGQLIDAVCIYALVAGMAASLGGAMMLLGGGVNYCFKISGAPSSLTLGVICALIVGAYTLSAITGLSKGIRFLSEINAVVFVLFLLFILLLGPTRFILSYAAEGVGHFLKYFVQTALGAGAVQQDEWTQKWTISHFANWVAWAPLVGIFLGRIGYGYTVRTFLVFNILLPAFFTGLWMAIFCGATVHMELHDGAALWSVLTANGQGSVMYAFAEHLPLVQIIVPAFLLTSFLSFVTGADAVTCAMGGLSSTGISPESPEPSASLKVFWGLLIGVLAWIMITFAQIDGIRMLSNLGAVPALFLCVAVVICAVMVVVRPARYGLPPSGSG